MKKILSALIYHLFLFDAIVVYLAYISDLEHIKQKFRVVELNQDVSGKVTLHIQKQYNNNVFPNN